MVEVFETATNEPADEEEGIMASTGKAIADAATSAGKKVIEFFSFDKDDEPVDAEEAVVEVFETATDEPADAEEEGKIVSTGKAIADAATSAGKAIAGAATSVGKTVVEFFSSTDDNDLEMAADRAEAAANRIELAADRIELAADRAMLAAEKAEISAETEDESDK